MVGAGSGWQSGSNETLWDSEYDVQVTSSRFSENPEVVFERDIKGNSKGFGLSPWKGAVAFN